MGMDLSLGSLSTTGGFPSQSGGPGFDWDPEGVTFGIDFTTDRVFDGETVTDDYSAVFGGDFDPSKVSALGMALFSANGNYPTAAGDLLAKFQSLDFTLIFFWRQVQLFGGNFLAGLADSDDTRQVEIYHDTGELVATDRGGDYNTVGIVRSFSDNVLAVSMSPAGWLSSLNGETAVLDDTDTTALIDHVWIGCAGVNDQSLEGWLKALIFYPATDVGADLEAYSANAAPVNTVAPAITGTAQVGQELSVSTGTWTDSPTSYEYQWYRDNFNGASAVGGATASTFTPTEAEFGVTMKCIVYALNADGIGGVAVSDDETVIAA